MTKTKSLVSTLWYVVCWMYETRMCDDIDILHGIKHILKSHSLLKKLTSQTPVEWPVTKVVLSKLKDENGGEVYQGSVLPRAYRLLKRSISPWCYITSGSCKHQALVDLKSLDEQMWACPEWSNVDLMRSILPFLELARLRGSFIWLWWSS